MSTHIIDPWEVRYRERTIKVTPAAFDKAVEHLRDNAANILTGDYCIDDAVYVALRHDGYVVEKPGGMCPDHGLFCCPTCQERYSEARIGR